MALPAFSQFNSGRAQNVTYGCTALVGSNKAGIIKPDAQGYRKMVIGALDSFNSGGAYYVLNDRVRGLFDQSSILQRRIADGALRGEMGHPRKQANMKPSDWLQRVLDIYEPNMCVHYKSVTLDFNSATVINGRPIVPIYAELAPTGAMGPALEKQLSNPNENVCFSIRSLTDDNNVGGVIQKEIKTIVTFDCVNEPGMANAKKWFAPSLECLDEMVIRPAHLKVVVDNTRRGGMESTRAMAIEVARALGWDHDDPKSPVIVPRDLTW